MFFAGVAVSDLEASTRWYARLLGRPPDIPVNEDEMMWRIADAASLYLLRDPGRAGHASITLAVPDLDAAIAEITERGLESRPIETVGDAGRKAPVIDPDGNIVNVIEVVAPPG